MSTNQFDVPACPPAIWIRRTRNDSAILCTTNVVRTAYLCRVTGNPKARAYMNKSNPPDPLTTGDTCTNRSQLRLKLAQLVGFSEENKRLLLREGRHSKLIVVNNKLLMDLNSTFVPLNTQETPIVLFPGAPLSPQSPSAEKGENHIARN